MKQKIPPSSKSHFIITGYQVFSRVAEYFEGSMNWGWSCNQARLVIYSLLQEQGEPRFGWNETSEQAIPFFIKLIEDYFFTGKLARGGGYWIASDSESRVIAMTMLAEICKSQQIKLYIPRK